MEQLESRLVPAFKVTPLGGLVTTEKLGTDTFTVVLTTRPTATVLVNFHSSDPTEGTVTPSALVFTSTNWNQPKTVTVRGVNDFVDDGNVPYQIILDPALSSDPLYNIDPPDVAVVNQDDDAAGIIVAPESGLIVNEGSLKFVTVRLTSQPTADVTIPILGNADVVPSPAQLVFTPTNWNVPQSFGVIAVADGLGNEPQDENHIVVVGPATSADPGYASRWKFVKLTIHEPPAPTTMTLTSSANPSVLKKTVTFTATVLPPPGSIAAKGTVTFIVRGVPTQVILKNGQARYSTSALPLGKHTIRAVYNGDGKRFKGSKASLVQFVQRLATPVALLTVSSKSVGVGLDGFPTITITGTARGDVTSHLWASAFFYGSSGPFQIVAHSWSPNNTRQPGQPETTTWTYTESVYAPGGVTGEVVAIYLTHPMKGTVKQTVSF